MPQIGKLLIVLGVVCLGLGVLLTLLGHLPFLRIGRLPGDIFVKRENFSFYFPLTTSIVLSLLLTLVFWLFSKR
ncbi:MAG: DUF2905 domain-containing protein [Acidobacteriota bacterium]